jgi:hypothetical protein
MADALRSVHKDDKDAGRIALAVQVHRHLKTALVYSFP